MLCPKCKTAATVKRIGDLKIQVCRNKNCSNYGKEVKRPTNKDSK